MASDEDETLYCICRQPYDVSRFMIACDKCNDWFHGSCVDINENQSGDIEVYHCPSCQKTHGPLVLKKRRSTHRYDYSEKEDNVGKAIRTGTVRFIAQLKGRKFANPEEDDAVIIVTDGFEMEMDVIEETQFRNPILVLYKEGLDVKVPPDSFSIQDVENHIGSMREIDVIDVAKQQDTKMLMREWTEYYTSSVRERVLNVISLEFSKTRLSPLVEPPRIVRQLSWVNNCWPKDVPEDKQEYEQPRVQKYCLMSIKDSYTDFHIDFGGTSVWYHVLRGEKIFYLIEPTETNLNLYEDWLSTPNQSEVFFGDQVEKCYRCVVKQGQTMFIPTGWIHSVLTPIDSLVFGGNFLHNFSIELQIKVYEIEKRTGAEKKYLFPNYETLHWYAAKKLLRLLQSYTFKKGDPPLYLLNGGKAMITALKAWTHKRDPDKSVPNVVHGYRTKYIKRENIPDDVQYGRLLKDLLKEVRNHIKISPQRKNVSKKDTSSRARVDTMYDTPGASTADDTSQSDLEVEVEVKDEDKNKVLKDIRPLSDNITVAHTTADESHEQDNKQTMQIQFKTKAMLKIPPMQFQIKSPKSELNIKSDVCTSYSSSSSSSISNPRNVTSSTSHTVANTLHRNTQLSPQQYAKPSSSSSTSSPHITAIQLPSRAHHSASSSSSSNSPRSTVTSPRASNSSSVMSTTTASIVTPPPPVQTDLFSPPRKITLKLNRGVICTQGAPSAQSVSQNSYSAEEDSEEGTESDAEDLVVDESPRKRRKMAATAAAVTGSGDSTPQQRAHLKLKFSVNKADIRSPSYDRSLESSQNTSFSDVDVVGDDSSYSRPTTITVMTSSFSEQPLVRGGGERLTPAQHSPEMNKNNNGRSIDNIIQANGGYSHSNRQQQQHHQPQQGSMRDAIQGMLNMSQLSTVSSTLQSSSKASPFILHKDKSKATIRLQRESRTRALLHDDELGEHLPMAYKDDDYIYPTLAESDNEEEMRFKSRSKLEKDDAWSPKGKVTSTASNMERPPRFNAKRESVESQLEDAAVKLANKPLPKRVYIKKKAKSLSPHSSTQLTGGDYTYNPSSPTPLYMDDGPSTSSSSTHRSQAHISSSSSSSKKPQKKSGSTAKQRLGKILGMHKMKF